MNFYKKAVGYIENEELEELCKSIDEFYEMLRGIKTCMKVI